MSRIGNTPVSIPSAVTVSVDDGVVYVKGPKGELQAPVPRSITVTIDGQMVAVNRGKGLDNSAYQGLIRSLISNMIEGVHAGYTKKLEMVGTGYRGRKQGNNLILNVGFSHPVEVKPMEGITLNMETDTIIVITGIDKQKVGETAAKIRAIRPPEPYKGKGIKYQGEVIRRKAGKTTKAGA